MTNYDFWASHSFYDSREIPEKAAVDYLLKEANNPYPQDISDRSARVALCALALLGDKEYARTGTRRESGGLVALYKQASFQDYLQSQLQQCRALLATSPDLSLLPAGSFCISFDFTLTRPYLSKDDIALHLLDNPVRKEWVFKLPYVAPTQWKGALQAVMVRYLGEWWQGLDETEQQKRSSRKRFVAQRIQLTRLFGTEIEHQQGYLSQMGDAKLARWYQRYVRCFMSRSGFLAGRLYFYPTLFDRLGLEVINPHDRETGAGSNPILIESVPTGTTGLFTLLYTPLDRIGQAEDETRRQVASDLQLVAAGLEALFTVYGFGAKTSSGFGVAGSDVAGAKLVLNIPDVVFAQEGTPQVQAPEDDYLKYLDQSGQVKSAFKGSGEGGLLSNGEYRKTGAQQGGGSLSEFKNFRRWYSEHGEIWQDQQQTATTDTTDSTANFESFRQLVAACQVLTVKPEATTGGGA